MSANHIERDSSSAAVRASKVRSQTTSYVLAGSTTTAAIANATPLSMAGYIVNVSVAVLAFKSWTPPAELASWAIGAYLLAAWLIYRWAVRSKRSIRLHRAKDERSSLAQRKAVLFGVLLALPWGSLGFWLLGSLPHERELILLALVTGMAASGSVLLSAAPLAAVTYMACILTPAALKCFLLIGGTEYDLLGVLAISYAVFLLNCIRSCAKLFAERHRAVEELSASLIEAQRARRETEHAALHDLLTGLPNRRALLGHSLLSGKEEATRYALFYIDLDRFKPINDTFGHDVGDKLRRDVGARLKACMRDGDFVARLGGDEFTLLADGIDDQAVAEVRASEVLAEICKPYIIDGHLLNIGVSLSGEDAGETGELLRMADLALYEAKAGRHRYCCYRVSMRTKLKVRQQLENDLRGAIPNNQLELFFQPIVELKTQRLFGAEALIRWNHPERGVIAPNEFLPIAEDIGLLRIMERWVLAEACEEAALWPRHLVISVNVSPSSIMHGEIAQIVSDILTRSKLDPDRLELEVTETAILNHDTETHRKFHELKTLGVSIAMDDFGTGYSSLAYLSRFPFDRIKIDRSFVFDLLKDPRSASIVAATVDMARALGLRTTAEGVETDLQLRKLQILGVELGQGYLFRKPLSKTELPQLFLREGLLAAGPGHSSPASAS